MVKAVSTAWRGRSPASLAALLPDRFASKSQSAQSIALRAAPAGRNVPRAARFAPEAIALAQPAPAEPLFRRVSQYRGGAPPPPRRRSLPSLPVAPTPPPSCFDPREMVKPPLIGHRSTSTVRPSRPPACASLISPSA